MSDSAPLPRRRVHVASAVLAALAVVLAADLATAAKKTSRRRARSLSMAVATPLGLQGTAGAGQRVVLPLVLSDRSARRVDVQVEYGVDLDGDGTIADGSDPEVASEFRTATQSRRDPRDTSRSRGGSAATYRPSRAGSSHAFVWNAAADLTGARYPAGPQIVRDAQGRPVPDPFDSAQVQFTDALPGVVLRVRAIRRAGRRVRTDWVATDAFSMDNSSRPSMTIDAVPVVDAAAGRVEIDWTAYDDDTEDANGNGLLDVLDLEDRNGNGQLDDALVAVSFDFHRLAPGATPPASAVLLGQLAWTPCTHAIGEGDPDDGVAAAPHGVGRMATFVWATVPDLGGPGFHEGRYLLRAIPYDNVGNTGEPVYLSDPIRIGEEQ